MDVIKKMQIKYLQSRKAELLERLRHNEREEDKMIECNDFNGYMELHRETEILHYRIDVINSRIHNIQNPDKKYYVLERSFPLVTNK